MDDRIFSTSVDLEYTFSEVPLKAPVDEGKLQFVAPEWVEGGSVWDEEVPGRARRATLEVFAEDESASVQVSEWILEIAFWAFTCRVFRNEIDMFFGSSVEFSSPVLFDLLSFLVILIHFCVYLLCVHYPIRRSFRLLLCHPKLITNCVLPRQATLFKMAQRIIAENAHIQTVTYTLPNKHYIPVDMRYIGVDNLTPLSVLPFLLSLFSCVLCLIVLFLLITMDTCSADVIALRRHFVVSANLLMTLCRRRSDFLSRPLLFIAQLFPLLATLVDARMLLFILCRFLCSTLFFLGSG